MLWELGRRNGKQHSFGKFIGKSVFCISHSEKEKGINVVIMVIPYLCTELHLLEWRKQVSKIGSQMAGITQPGIERGSFDDQIYVTINACQVKTFS